jgi:hypothetical protein
MRELQLEAQGNIRRETNPAPQPVRDARLQTSAPATRRSSYGGRDANLPGNRERGVVAHVIDEHVEGSGTPTLQLPVTTKPHSWACTVKALAFGGAAIAIGIYIRVNQLVTQVLVDDEWHAVHQIIRSTPARMLFDLGYSDYSIPLGILGWYEANLVGLSEMALRWPSMVAGILTLLLFPLYVSRQFGPRIAVWFAALLAISPLLVIIAALLGRMR